MNKYIYYIAKHYDDNFVEIHYMHSDEDNVIKIYNTMIENRQLFYCNEIVLMEWDMERQVANPRRYDVLNRR